VRPSSRPMKFILRIVTPESYGSFEPACLNI
jgi:hypothetical protein